jgi:hypothetical protein
MIRPFNLRDLALVHRLSEQGVALHTESALTGNLYPLRGALANMFVRSDYPTYVWKANEGSAAGFIQLFVRESNQPAYIMYLSAAGDTAVTNGDQPAVDETAWLALLDRAILEVGQRGIHNLVAEVNETGPELPILRQAGFAVYMRQDVWVLAQAENSRSEMASLELTPYQKKDDWEVQLLYANTVPRLVQMVDPMPPTSEGEGWVLREGGELSAFAHVHQGDTATWLRLFIHPNAEAQADEIVASLLHLKEESVISPVYCCLPRYQSWLQGGLERTGFRFWGSQAVMVKHTVQHLQKSMVKTAVLETGGIPVRNYEGPLGTQQFTGRDA